MHTQLLNIGFVKMPDGSYYNNELGLRIKVTEDKQILVETPMGTQKATIKDLENAIVAGGFGEF